MRSAIVGLAGPVLAADEAKLLRELPPAGVILFRRNIIDPPQLAQLMADLRAVLPARAVLMVDQEGGRVARLRPPHWYDHPPAAAIGALYAHDPLAGRQAAFLTGALIGLDCRAAGFDLVAAPVLDLALPEGHEVIGDRAFASDPHAVALLGGAVAEGLLAAGLQPIIKHAPGHGRAPLDSHLALPRVSADAATLAADLDPFARLHHLPWMMTAHVCFDAWDAARPATLSRLVIGGVIRGQIGFAGLLMTDDLAMQALSGGPAERATAAFAAGCDIALHCSGIADDTRAVLMASPQVGPRVAGLMGAAVNQAARNRRGTLSAAVLADARAELLA